MDVYDVYVVTVEDMGLPDQDPLVFVNYEDAYEWADLELKARGYFPESPNNGDYDPFDGWGYYDLLGNAPFDGSGFLLRLYGPLRVRADLNG